jgi:hypothetical protein
MNRIIYLQDNGIAAVIIPTTEALEQYGIQGVAEKDVPDGRPYKIVYSADIPSDRTFRGAWKVEESSLDGGVCSKGTQLINADLEAAKEISNEMRRDARALEFAPLDIEATIPSKAESAEAKRQAIREKYDLIQTQIEKATEISELKTIVNDLLKL